MKKAGTLIIFAGVFLVVFAAMAQTQINVDFPGGKNPTTNPGGIIANFYQFALMIGGVLALGAIVYGGIKYTFAAGNPSGQSEGKEWIKGALWGLFLLIGAYFILNIINPSLTNLELPTLETPELPEDTSNLGLPNNGCIGSACPANGCLSGTCQALNRSGIACRPNANCGADPALASALQLLANKTGGIFTVSEGYPPTTSHHDPKHYNGCAVDLVITNFSGPADCAKVNAILNNVRSSGLTSINEYTQCGGVSFDTTTGQNIHIDGCR